MFELDLLRAHIMDQRRKQQTRRQFFTGRGDEFSRCYAFNNLTATTTLGFTAVDASILNTGGTNVIPVPLTLIRPQAWTFAASGKYGINQASTTIFTATKNTTTRLDLSGAVTNIAGQTSQTYTIIKYILFELLFTGQDLDPVSGSDNGNAFADSVVIAPSGTFPVITSPLGAAQTYTMQSGDKWLCQKGTSAGIVIAAGSADGFDFTIAANNLDAKFRITVLGNL